MVCNSLASYRGLALTGLIPATFTKRSEIHFFNPQSLLKKLFDANFSYLRLNLSYTPISRDQWHKSVFGCFHEFHYDVPTLMSFWIILSQRASIVGPTRISVYYVNYNFAQISRLWKFLPLDILISRLLSKLHHYTIA